MTIKNTCPKIINIGATVLMPDAEMSVSETMKNNPVFQLLVEMGKLSVADAAGESKPKVSRSRRTTSGVEATAAASTANTAESTPAISE